METKPMIGDLVNDARCSDASGFGRTGLVLSVVGDVCWVLWPSAPDMPLWAPVGFLEVIN